MFSKADAYERFMGRWSRLMAPALSAFAEVRPADCVLDVGSGTGSLASSLNAATGVERITGVDASAEYVSYANHKLQQPDIHFEVGDAQQLKFSDATFDKALSLLVLNFVPDPTRAVSEMMRVTKPGGSVAAAVWDYGDGMQMLRVFWDEATALDANIAAQDEAHMPLCRKGQLLTLWQRQGFANAEEAPLTAELRFDSFADYWAPFLLGQGPAGAYVASLAPDRQSLLEQRLRKRFLGDGPDHALEMVARCWAVKGRVA